MNNEMKLLTGMLWEPHPTIERLRPTAFCHQCFDRDKLPADERRRYEDHIIDFPEDMENAAPLPEWSGMVQTLRARMRAWLYPPHDLDAVAFATSRTTEMNNLLELDEVDDVSADLPDGWNNLVAALRLSIAVLDEQLGGGLGSRKDLMDMADWLEIAPTATPDRAQESLWECVEGMIRYVRRASVDWLVLGGVEASTVLRILIHLREEAKR